MAKTDLTRLCLRLRSSDVEFIRELAQSTEQEFTTIVREMVNKVCNQMRAHTQRKIDAVETPNISNSEVISILESANTGE